jgi:hypothetical protein
MNEMGGHVVLWRKGEVHTGLWKGDLRERDQLEYAGVDGRIILKWFLKKKDWEAWTGLIWLKVGQVEGAC